MLSLCYTPMHDNNHLNVDFRMYSSMQDLVADQNRWTFCNYVSSGNAPGFPRDCGATGRVNGNWNRVTGNVGKKNIRFTIYTAPSGEPCDWNDGRLPNGSYPHGTITNATVSSSLAGVNNASARAQPLQPAPFIGSSLDDCKRECENRPECEQISTPKDDVADSTYCPVSPPQRCCYLWPKLDSFDFQPKQMQYKLLKCSRSSGGTPKRYTCSCGKRGTANERCLQTPLGDAQKKDTWGTLYEAANNTFRGTPTCLFYKDTMSECQPVRKNNDPHPTWLHYPMKKMEIATNTIVKTKMPIFDRRIKGFSLEQEFEVRGLPSSIAQNNGCLRVRIGFPKGGPLQETGAISYREQEKLAKHSGGRLMTEDEKNAIIGTNDPNAGLGALAKMVEFHDFLREPCVSEEGHFGYNGCCAILFTSVTVNSLNFHFPPDYDYAMISTGCSEFLRVSGTKVSHVGRTISSLDPELLAQGHPWRAHQYLRQLGGDLVYSRIPGPIQDLGAQEEKGPSSAEYFSTPIASIMPGGCGAEEEEGLLPTYRPGTYWASATVEKHPNTKCGAQCRCGCALPDQFGGLSYPFPLVFSGAPFDGQPISLLRSACQARCTEWISCRAYTVRVKPSPGQCWLWYLPGSRKAIADMKGGVVVFSQGSFKDQKNEEAVFNQQFTEGAIVYREL